MPHTTTSPKLPMGALSVSAELPEFCGPQELAKVVTVLRRWDSAPAFEGNISEAGIRRLIELAYQVSLTTEEGRHPRFRMFVSAPPSGEAPEAIARFDPPIPLRADTLHKMVPAVASRMHALKVVQAPSGQLFADSIVGVDDGIENVPVGRPEVAMGLGMPGFMVRVDGPGRLRATEKGFTQELRDGRVKPVNHYAMVSVVRKWFDELGKRLLDETGTMGAANELSESDPAIVFDSVWSYTLATTVAVSHGGAFAVLPDESPAGIRIKYPARDLDVAKNVLRFWASCFDSEKETAATELERKGNLWESAKRRMFSAARALAELANVDGCVVLDRRMRLVGFGGEIRINDEDVRGALCSEADPETLAHREPVDIERWGTRHRSAFRLCASRPGTLMFVVSQDGDLGVFYGLTPQRVCVWRSLGAWMTASDRW